MKFESKSLAPNVIGEMKVKAADQVQICDFQV